MVLPLFVPVVVASAGAYAGWKAKKEYNKWKTPVVLVAGAGLTYFVLKKSGKLK